MTQPIIDLRKPRAILVSATLPSRAAPIAHPSGGEHDHIAIVSPKDEELWHDGGEQESDEISLEDEEAVMWSALEHEPREYTTRWFLGMGVLALIFILFGILAKSYLFIALVVVASFVLLMYAKRPPREISCAITTEGIWVGGRLYRVADLVSFCIFDRHDRRELSLETKHHLTGFLALPLGEADAVAVRGALLELIPERPHTEHIIETLARLLRM